ncbi:hypothetical protein DD604_07315 [Enterobacter cloacae]|nr:hypothetical protein DD604_07315 [Enterobacter cloacae]
MIDFIYFMVFYAVLYIITVFVYLFGGVKMGNKNNFDPGIASGVQVYLECGHRIVVVHPGGYLDRIEEGQCVLFETTPTEDGTRMFWFGVVSSNAYYFMVEVALPVDIFMVRSWYYAQQAMLEAHDGELGFCDMQGELPF